MKTTRAYNVFSGDINPGLPNFPDGSSSVVGGGRADSPARVLPVHLALGEVKL